MALPGVVRCAFTEDQVARLTGVSKRQMRYWARDGFFVSSIDLSDAGISQRLYSFRDLVSLKVLGALRNKVGVPLSHLRDVKKRLNHLGEDLWASTTLFVLGKRIVFENDEASRREDAVSGQAILEIPLRIVTGEMEEAVGALRRRDPDHYGRVARKRSVAQNQPVLAGTRIPVRAVKDFNDAGYSVEEIGLQYPSLTEADIRAAIAFEEAA